MACENRLKKGLRDGIPIALGYLSVSFTFGMAAAAGDLPTAYALAVSMTNLTSAGQFAGLSLLLAGGSYAEMALTQFVVNLRYALMSVSLSQKLDKSVRLLDRLLIAFGNTDEIFAVATGQGKPVGSRYMFGLIAMPYVGWALGTFLGAAAASLLPASLRSALGIAIYGMFLAIFIPPMKKSGAVAAVVLTAAALSCAFCYIPALQAVSSGFVIILCAVSAAAVGALIKPVPETEGAP
ncbi:MAG TPA: AzlC family ABC transporter permease [Candidatus Fimenecus excrementigallinarum]|uniref:AzlC family ABC transporter permease n=1 Tax=Candidatus Fimenecus excrementigallinarum TaxID=2840816 RepID=A0A9D1IDY2_9FIRM|nr:AzlC family ABC transporter permease [Candidatus Fimenecus excrementigallinarum]